MAETERPERRREKRNPVIFSVYYSSFPEPHKESRYYGLAMDMSKSGLSLYSYSRMKEGAEIDVKAKKWPDSRKATVRWCKKKISGRFYKSGLSFQ